MTNRDGRSAAALVDRYVGPLDAPRSFRKVLANIVQKEAWASESTVQVVVNDLQPAFTKFITDRVSKAAQKRRLLSFEISPASSDHLQGSCFIYPDDNEEIAKHKMLRANALPMLQSVQDLTPRQFEFLCGLILRNLGVERPFVSRSSNDQGVDFFGRAPFGRLLQATVLPDAVEEPLEIWIVGQAKRKNETKVGTADLRELVGSVELARAKSLIRN